MSEMNEGSVIGNYRVVRMLGQGGMGTVYEVEHVELGTHYALKTYTFDSDGEISDALKRKSLEEGKLLARLKHPNLTHVFDLGFEGQMPYFVMDLVTYEDGGTYTVEDIDLKDIDEDMVYGWFKQLASALDYIHGEGIVHRDIKPSNLLVDKNLNIVLTDFGISRVFGSKIRSEVQAENTMVTKTGRGKIVLGTRHYIAPEVAEGEEATPKADAYALGVMLLRWLTGFYYGDNPGAIALLPRNKYCWLTVISRLLAPADRRPESYTPLLEMLKPTKAAVPAPAPVPVKSARKSASRAKVDVVAIVARSIVILGFLGLFGVGAWQFWQRYEADKLQQQKQVEELRRQMEAKAAAEKAERERLAAEHANKEAEAKRIAEEKAREEEKARKEAEMRRLAEERAKAEAEAKRIAEEKARQNKPAKPPKEKPKGGFIVVPGDDEDTKDYGPIPNKKYAWLKNNDAAKPQLVTFELSNGAKMDLLPMKSGVFFMSNESTDDKAYHKVIFTRPFWVSKYRVTTEQWREFDEGDVAECVEIEKALGGLYPLSKRMQRKRIELFCDYLSKRYGKQLPKGYVFRLPTEAEWDYAVDVEGTVKMYCDSAGVSQNVGGTGEIASEKIKKLLAKSELKTRFERVAFYDKWVSVLLKKNTRSLCIGGFAKPNVNGIYDITCQICLDKILWGDKVEYADEETDPLFWTNEKGRVRDFGRGWLADRWWPNAGESRFYHIVVGPDLVKERAWEHCRIKRAVAPVKMPIQARGFNLNPAKIPDKLLRPKIVSMKMTCGAEMEFCAIPKGTFHMSNPDGQVKSTHKVTLTRPFWITRYCVTASQWRDFAKYDCEGDCRKAEECFKKYPICPEFNKYKWDAFCRHLNDSYSSLLPKGYVFRLPTEAEWEWAFVANSGGNIRNIDRRSFDPRHEKNRVLFRKKEKMAKGIAFDEVGTTHFGSLQGRIFVGGRLSHNAFGVCDMIGPRGALVFDEYEAFGDTTSRADRRWDAHSCRRHTERYFVYEDEEIDPVHWDGLRSVWCVTRNFESRGFWYEGDAFFAHIAVAPVLEIVDKVLDEESRPYPHEAFGGELLSDRIKVTDMSSRHNRDGHNKPERWALLVSDEPVIVSEIKEGKDIRGCHTENEKSPWVQLSLDSATEITGIQVDTFRCQPDTEHLRIWTSEDEDGKEWHEVAKDDVIRSRYKFDLRGKHIKAKHIRVGREGGFKKDFFSVNKILVYGKK